MTFWRAQWTSVNVVGVGIKGAGAAGVNCLLLSGRYLALLLYKANVTTPNAKRIVGFCVCFSACVLRFLFCFSYFFGGWGVNLARHSQFWRCFLVKCCWRFECSTTANLINLGFWTQVYYRFSYNSVQASSKSFPWIALLTAHNCNSLRGGWEKFVKCINTW